MAKKIPANQWQPAIAAYLGGNADRHAQATAVRGLLQVIAERYPGRSVEVRVPPFGAVQCIEGPGHTRGTPANVVEMKPDIFLSVALGLDTWARLRSQGAFSASGARSDLAELFPILSVAEIERIQMNYQAE